MTVDEMVEALKAMTLAEAEELVEKLTEAFPKLAEMPAGGGMMMAMPGAAAGGDAAAAVEEEPTEFNVILSDIGAEKIQVIKVVRALTNLGLKEAKDAVESAPFTVLESVEKEAAEDAAKKLAEAGAKADIKPA